MEYFTICEDCKGRGKRSRRISKKNRLQYQIAFDQFKKNGEQGVAPIQPRASLYVCLNCKGSGLVHSQNQTVVNNEKHPHIAIIGAGIGGVALAIACLHRGIPFTLYERDSSFDVRAQGYGLTLQQASKAIEGFGVFSLEKGVVSTRHVVHTTEGKVVGEWGTRKWMLAVTKTSQKRRNVHIARQSLRSSLLEQLGGHDKVQWGHQLIDYKEKEGEGIELNFQVNGEIKVVKADLLVGADGIRSAVRRLLIGEEKTPLRYLGCIVILGICPLKNLKGFEHPLLDSETVFQTANGNERIYIMPYDADSVMWQLSFPMLENEAKELSALGAKALKEEACRRTRWHDPIPQILNSTSEMLVSGYPVYDRALLEPELLAKETSVTLIGDAAHPMSPFKGQGANQALLDALSLARSIYKGCSSAQWREVGLRKSILIEFETEMLKRSAIKVKDSADAALFLHSEIALYEADEPRGSCRKI